MKTWSDIYYKHLNKGVDHGSAAHLADNRNKTPNKQAIALRRIGDYVVVEVKTKSGNWVEVIRELHDNAFSHIVESKGHEGIQD